MPRSLRFALTALVFAAVISAPLPLADAASTQYLLTGELGSAAAPSRLDNAEFAFRLNFDEPAEPDFDLLGFSSDSQRFAADTWSLDLFGGSGLLSRFDQDSNRANVGFAIFTGEITGIDVGETTIRLGVDTNPADRRVVLEDTLIDLEFFTDELVSAFFVNDITAVPADIGFVEGSVLDLGSGLRVPVASSSLVVAELSEPILVEDSGDSGLEVPAIGDGATPEPPTRNGDPAAVPTPGAAVGGLLLMLVLVVRQLNRTQQRSEAA